jgi:hypothetical protein
MDGLLGLSTVPLGHQHTAPKHSREEFQRKNSSSLEPDWGR